MSYDKIYWIALRARAVSAGLLSPIAARWIDDAAGVANSENLADQVESNRRMIEAAATIEASLNPPSIRKDRRED